MTSKKTQKAEEARDDLRWELIAWSDALKVSGRRENASNQAFLKDLASSSSQKPVEDDSEEKREEISSEPASDITAEDIEKKLSSAGYYDSIKRALELSGLTPVRTNSVGEQIDLLDPVGTLENLSTSAGSFIAQSQSLSNKEAAEMMKKKYEESDESVRDLIGTIIEHSYQRISNETEETAIASNGNNESSDSKNWLIVLFLVIGMVIAITAGVIIG